MRRRRLPARGFETLGYNVAVHGQKTFNGVAILSKLPFDEVENRACPATTSDDHARFIEAWSRRRTARCASPAIYLPNGNPPDTEKYHLQDRVDGTAYRLRT